MLFALHIPDHTLSGELTGLAFVAVAIAAAVGFLRLRGTPPRPTLGLFAVVTSLLFAVQLVNFPLLDGRTSGHVLGAGAAVLLLGPMYGMLAMSLVLVVQALLLGDGGVTALGANLLNMAVFAPLAAIVVAKFVERRRADAAGTIAGAVLAGALSTVVAALACSAELAMSGVGSFGDVAVTLVGQHALLGIVEGAFTAAVVFPMVMPSVTGRRIQPAALAGVAAIVFALAPLSSELPDTLESVLSEQPTTAMNTIR